MDESAHRSTGTEQPDTESSGNVRPAKKRSRRKGRSKKPADMPRRPLSAYNLFFREERTRLLAERSSDTGAAGTSKVPLFSQMGKIIAKRWKELPADEAERLRALAQEDMARYRREMEEYTKARAFKVKREVERAHLLARAEESAADIPTPATAPSLGLSAEPGLDPSVSGTLDHWSNSTLSAGPTLDPMTVQSHQLLADNPGRASLNASVAAQWDQMQGLQLAMQNRQLSNPTLLSNQALMSDQTLLSNQSLNPSLLALHSNLPSAFAQLGNFGQQQTLPSALDNLLSSLPQQPQQQQHHHHHQQQSFTGNTGSDWMQQQPPPPQNGPISNFLLDQQHFSIRGFPTVHDPRILLHRLLQETATANPNEEPER